MDDVLTTGTTLSEAARRCGKRTRPESWLRPWRTDKFRGAWSVERVGWRVNILIWQTIAKKSIHDPRIFGKTGMDG